MTKRKPHPAAVMLCKGLACGGTVERLTFKGLTREAAQRLTAEAEQEGHSCDCGSSGGLRIVTVSLKR